MKKTSRTIVMTAALVTSVGLVLTGCGTVRAGYESAPYKVVRSTRKFEVRDYPALTVTETPMKSGRNGEDGSFGRLFRFISGGNEAQQKIAMTTPVFMSGDETNAAMAFVMPTKMKTADVPKPNDSNVRVRELEAGRFAVLRFSGGRNAENEAESLASLRAWMETEGLKEMSLPIYGYFDPPWTPAFLRRNEVMIRLTTSALKPISAKPN
jgi:DNA gyrase inhibitor GyrI